MTIARTTTITRMTTELDEVEWVAAMMLVTRATLPPSGGSPSAFEAAAPPRPTDLPSGTYLLEPFALESLVR